MALLVTGTETDSTTLEWAMSPLLNHPDQLDQIRAKIDFKVGQGRLLDEQDLPNLHYLQIVINETLRFYPPVMLLGVLDVVQMAGLANWVIGLVLGSLIQSFEWERTKVDMSEGLGLTMPKIRPLEALCKPRLLMQRF
ncbi:putative oxidoreductase [Rosa chinensis]|uniref:Putative oxidoreductase n=1 Tax=Rosa chinensis TaxID=74649 RepID=A0A2P6Q0X1_ROSCH|nr:putative oxidoreductase [Rosa chinensis]